MDTPSFKHRRSTGSAAVALAIAATLAPSVVRADAPVATPADKPAQAEPPKKPASAVTVHSAVEAMGSRSSSFVLSDDESDANMLRELPVEEKPPEHKGLSLGIAGGIFGALYGYTYLAWYYRAENAPSLQFHDEGWFGVDTYAGGADKMGHTWGNYALVRGISGILQWGGWNRKMALTTATGATVAFFAMSEIKDGYNPEYGFSWTDVGANLAGVGLGLLLEASPRLDDMFDFRVEYWPSKPFRDSVAERGPFNSPEDYTGQRFFLAYHLSSIEPLRESEMFGWSEYVDVALGFRAAHYKPEETDSEPHTQELFMGVSLNVQRLVDKTFMPERGSGQRPSTGARALRFTTEIVQIPFTTVQVGGFSRSIPDPVPAAPATTSTSKP